MSEPTPEELAAAAFMQGDGTEIMSIVLNSMAAAAEREGREVTFADGIGLMLTAAWGFAKMSDPNLDGGRGRRYAALLRQHADAVETAG